MVPSLTLRRLQGKFFEESEELYDVVGDESILKPSKVFGAERKLRRPLPVLVHPPGRASKMDLGKPLLQHFEDLWTDRNEAKKTYLYLRTFLEQHDGKTSATKEYDYETFACCKILYPMNLAANDLITRFCKNGEPSIDFEGNDRPVLLVCSDVTGKIGGLENVLERISFPCFQLDIFRDEMVWSAKKMEDLASVAAKHLREFSSTSRSDHIILGGVGFGSVLAHALAVHAQTMGLPGPLVLFEGHGALVDDAAAVDWINKDEKILFQQLSAKIFDVLFDAQPCTAQIKEALLVTISAQRNLADTLSLLASLRPEGYDDQVWMVEMEIIMIRFALFEKLSRQYSPDEHSVRFEGHATCFLQHERANTFERCIQESGGPDHIWQSIVDDLQPISTFLFPKSHSYGVLWTDEETMDLEVTIDYIAHLQKSAFRYRALRLVAALEEAAMKDVNDNQRRARVKLIEDAKHMAGDIKGEHLEELGAEAVASSVSSTDTDQLPTFCVVEPLNDACEEYISKVESNEVKHDDFPFWMIHVETGDVSHQQRAFAELLDRPCFGLALGPDTLDPNHESEISSLHDLAKFYADTIISMQPHGLCYYIIAIGTYVGACLAHQIGCIFEEADLPVALFLIDAAPGWDEKSERLFMGQGSHDAPLKAPNLINYALYYFLLDMGMDKVKFNAFQDDMESREPWEQLRLIDSKYRPQKYNEDKDLGHSWDAELVIILQKCAFLNRLSRKLDEHRSRKDYSPELEHFNGPGTLFVPHGIQGFAFEASSKPFLELNERGGINVVNLLCEHGEALMQSESRKIVLRLLNKAAIRARRFLIERQESELY